MNKTKKPPVILLGGTANALSVARALGKHGIRVYALNDPTAHVRFSRHCRWLPVPWKGTDERSWDDFLTGPSAKKYAGAVLLACCDAGIRVIARQRDILARRFILDDSNPAAQLDMLNKLRTYQHAVAAGVPTPRFWLANGELDLLKVKDELAYPLLVKPVWSHEFGERFHKKFFWARDFDELRSGYRKVSDAGIEVMLVEKVPGPDTLLCSYYTYLDEHGAPLFDFTKRVLRRFPENMGEACYHITDWNPDVREEALKLFRAAGLRGLANAEFKRDPRDGKLKLIECNARFTAANCLVAESGLDLATFVYNRLTGQPLPPFAHYRRGLRLWYPTRDFRAFVELWQQGKISLRQWLASVLRPAIFPYFCWEDPAPTFGVAAAQGLAWLRQLARSWRDSIERRGLWGHVSNVSGQPGSLKTCPHN